MVENVNALYGRPIYSKTGVQFLKIVIHPDKQGSGSNIYLATGRFCNLLHKHTYSIYMYSDFIAVKMTDFR